MVNLPQLAGLRWYIEQAKDFVCANLLDNSELRNKIIDHAKVTFGLDIVRITWHDVKEYAKGNNEWEQVNMFCASLLGIQPEEWVLICTRTFKMLAPGYVPKSLSSKRAMSIIEKHDSLTDKEKEILTKIVVHTVLNMPRRCKNCICFRQ